MSSNTMYYELEKVYYWELECDYSFDKRLFTRDSH